MPRLPWILMYHSIDTARSDPHMICVSPAQFSVQMEWLSRQGFRGVSMAELMRSRDPAAEKLVGLTFDDGFEDFLDNAMPVLDRHGFTATAFVIAERLGGYNDWDFSSGADKRKIMSVEQVRELASTTIEVGSHSLTHRHLPELSDSEAEAEIAGSRMALERIIDKPVLGFCYPYGSVDARISAMTQQAGYRYACATKATIRPSGHSIPRCFVGERDTPLRLALKRVRHLAIAPR
ncbi:polysaccharide deacetylase family protein [Kitasatospora sp. NPDC101176]